MAKVVGDIAVSVGADVSGLERGMKRGGRSVKDFDNKAAAMGARIGKVGVGLAAVGVTAVAAGLKIASSAGKAATEIENMSRLAGVGAEKFQKLAAAGEKVGFSQEKMADIFKDVNDKFGDFMTTGAGPLKDFFENIAPQIGVTAGQFAHLSGPDALQLYVSSLEQANVSQQEMTFYMEALASDATALVPLLANNGKEMKRFGQEAQRAGRILSNDMVANGAELDRKLSDLASTLKAKLTAAVLENAEKLTELVTVFTEKFIPALIAVGKFVAGVASQIVDLGKAIAGAGKSVLSFYEKASAWAKKSGFTAEGLFGRDVAGAMGATLSPQTGRAAGDLLRSGSGTGRTGPDAGMFATPMIAPFPNAGGGGGGGGSGASSSGGGGGGGAGDFAAFQQSLATQADQLEFWREEQIEKLREFRDAKLATDEEYNQLEAQINEQHAKSLAEIESRAQQQKLQAFSGAFSNLSSLMSSENDKLFKVGKAAALGQAIMEGYSSASAAWNKGMIAGGLPMAAAFTAASVAKTAGLISSIQSSSPRGGGGGGGASGGGAAAVGQSTQRVIQVDFGGADMVPTSSVRDFTDQLAEEFEGGTRVVYS